MPTVDEALEQARRLRAEGQLAEAEAIYRQLVQALPQAGELWGELGIFFLEAYRPDAAVAPLVEATRLEPGNGAFHGALGAAYRLLKRKGTAVASFQRALDVGPPTPQLLNNLGLALKDDRQFEVALQTFDRALAMQPDFQNGHFNRANLLLGMGRMSDAIAGYQAAIRLKSDDAAAHCGLGVARYNLGELDAAMAAFDAAQAWQPDYADVRRNQSLIWFLRGEYAKAWPLFESRIECEDFAKRDFPQPRWHGEPLAGRTLFVLHEQGLGDTLQFVRYLPSVARAAGRVWFEPQAGLRSLLVQSGYGELLATSDSPPQFDVHALLMSLPGHLPDGSGAPYWPGNYLQADPRRVAHWQERLRDVAGFKIGIVWSGNPDQAQNHLRSVHVREFLPLAQVNGVRLVSLQKGEASKQLAHAPTELNVLDLGDELDAGGGAFMDTAAVIANLDLVISIDTSVAHLAGGMGAPVWLALHFAPDWRWLAAGDASPWYPSMRIFRQPAFADWPTVFANMARELRRRVQGA